VALVNSTTDTLKNLR